MFSEFGNDLKYAVKYTRVSTNQQDDRGSKEIQDLRINEFAEKHSFKIVNSFTDTDHGDNPLRPGINSLKNYLKVNGEIKYVICLFQDRFTRDFREGLENLYFLKDLGVSLVTVNEGLIKLDGTFDSIPALIRFIGSQEEKTKIVKKTKDSMYNYAVTGNRFLGGSVLPWFKIIRGNLNGVRCSLIVKNDETWDYYKKIFLEIIKHKSLKIVSEKENIPYPTLREWIYKPELTGYRTFGKRGRNENNYKKGRRKIYQTSTEKVLPAILTDEEFEKIQLIYKTTPQANIIKSYPYLFTKISYCKCGGKFGGNKFNERNSKKVKNFYRCQKCNKRYIAQKIEKIIIDKLLNDDNLKMLNDYEFRIADYIDEIKHKENQVISFQEKEKNILDLMNEDLISLETAKDKLKEIKKHISQSQKEIEEIKNNIEIEKQKEITSDMLDSFKYLLLNYDEDTLDELQQILNLIIKKIIIHSYDEIEIIY